jgi:hypothetical protein
MDGSLSLIDHGETFRCRCGKTKDGSKRGPKGGRQWAWKLPDGSRVCSKTCPGIGILADGRATDDARGDWEAQQAMEKYAS